MPARFLWRMLPGSLVKPPFPYQKAEKDATCPVPAPPGSQSLTQPRVSVSRENSSFHILPGSTVFHRKNSKATCRAKQGITTPPILPSLTIFLPMKPKQNQSLSLALNMSAKADRYWWGHQPIS